MQSLINPQFPFSQLSPPQGWAPGAILFTCEAWWIHHFRFPSHLPTELGPRSYIIYLRSLMNPPFQFSQSSPHSAGPQELYYLPAKLDKSTISILTAIPSWCWAPGAILFTCEAWLIHNYPSHSYPPTALGPRSYIIHLQSLINPKFPFSLLSSWGWAPGSYIIHLRSLMNPPFPFSQSSPHRSPQEFLISQ